MAHYFAYRQIEQIEADSMEEAVTKMVYSVRGDSLAWWTTTPNAHDKKRGAHYPSIIVMKREQLPWNAHTENDFRVTSEAASGIAHF